MNRLQSLFFLSCLLFTITGKGQGTPAQASGWKTIVRQN